MNNEDEKEKRYTYWATITLIFKDVNANRAMGRAREAADCAKNFFGEAYGDEALDAVIDDLHSDENGAFE